MKGEELFWYPVANPQHTLSKQTPPESGVKAVGNADYSIIQKV